jgi:hypothetical protein
MSHENMSKSQHDDMKKRHRDYPVAGLMGGWGVYPGFYTAINNMGNYSTTAPDHESSETTAQEALEDPTAGGGRLDAGMGDIAGGSPTSGDSVSASADVGSAASA